jgi:hypothetical protein
LITHIYVLLHFVLLAGKVGVFDIELRAQIEDPEVRTRQRRRLPSNIFVQFLAGPPEVRDGIIGLLLWLIALISLVIGPIALLVFFQLQFLPYHDAWITWWQRFAVLTDLALLWTLWPRIALPKEVFAEKGEKTRRSVVEATRRIGTIVGMALLSIISVPLVFTIATFPGEWLENLPPVRLIPTTRAAWTLPSVQAIQTAGSGWATLKIGRLWPPRRSCGPSVNCWSSPALILESTPPVARVHLAEVPFEIRDCHSDRTLLENLPEPLLALAKRCFRALSVRNVPPVEAN